MRISLTAPKTVKSLLWVFNILITLACLVSCASNRAPVRDISAAGGNALSHHIVSRGETLYSIAWRYGLDYKELASRNGVDRNFTIFPGQKIYLAGTPPRTSAAQASSGRAQANSQSSAHTSLSRSRTTTTGSGMAKPLGTTASRVNWQWPAPGRLLAGFSSQKSLHMGVDIEGRLGESVVAAADGVVVYAGSGIRGYGNLLIVKHNEVFLSAYAHNSKLLVQEKATVRRGQKIAEIGSSGTDRSKLHFEIRREGKPVDPLQYLPRR